MLILYGTNFDAPDAHFDKLCLFSDAQTEMLEIRNMKVKLCKSDQCSAKRLGPKTLKDQSYA